MFSRPKVLYPSITAFIDCDAHFKEAVSKSLWFFVVVVPSPSGARQQWRGPSCSTLVLTTIKTIAALALLVVDHIGQLLPAQPPTCFFQRGSCDFISPKTDSYATGDVVGTITSLLFKNAKPIIGGGIEIALKLPKNIALLNFVAWKHVYSIQSNKWGHWKNNMSLTICFSILLCYQFF